MNRKVLQRAALTSWIALGIASLVTGAAQAQVYFVGANLFPTDSTGELPLDYQYYNWTTNSTSGSTSLIIRLDSRDYDKNISFPLSDGDNSFYFQTGARHDDPGLHYHGLNLFFNSTGVSYNPPQTYSGIAGNLTVFDRDAMSDLFTVTPAGKPIQSYELDGQDNFGAFANGASTFTVAGKIVRVEALTTYDWVDGDIWQPSGGFTLYVSNSLGAPPVPEPGTLALLLCGGLGGGLLALRRRRDR